MAQRLPPPNLFIYSNSRVHWTHIHKRQPQWMWTHNLQKNAVNTLRPRTLCAMRLHAHLELALGICVPWPYITASTSKYVQTVNTRAQPERTFHTHTPRTQARTRLCFAHRGRDRDAKLCKHARAFCKPIHNVLCHCFVFQRIRPRTRQKQMLCRM